MDYIGHYMLGEQYRADPNAGIDEAVLYAKSVHFSRDGNDVWVFDIDETSLSNLPYYAAHNFNKPTYTNIYRNWPKA